MAELGADRLNTEQQDEEEEEEEEQHYPCPYCKTEYVIESLCSHLDMEHSSETLLTVCTVCNTGVSGEMSTHISTQHAHLFTMRSPHRSRRMEIRRTEALSRLREANLLRCMRLAGNGQWSSTVNTDPPPSSEGVNYSAAEAEEISNAVTSFAEDFPSKSVPSEHIWKASFDPSLSFEEREKRLRQVAGKAAFMRDMLCSTMLSD